MARRRRAQTPWWWAPGRSGSLPCPWRPKGASSLLSNRHKTIRLEEEIRMSKHDEARRAFLVGAAAGAGAIASVGLVGEAQGKDAKQAKDAKPHERHKTAAAEAADASMPARREGHGAFLSDAPSPSA